MVIEGSILVRMVIGLLFSTIILVVLFAKTWFFGFVYGAHASLSVIIFSTISLVLLGFGVLTSNTQLLWILISIGLFAVAIYLTLKQRIKREKEMKAKWGSLYK